MSEFTLKEIKQTIANKSAVQRIIKRVLEDSINKTDYKYVDAYNLQGKAYNFDAGNRERLVILFNATHKVAEANEALILETPLEMFGKENDYQAFLPISGDNHIITSENGIPLAEWYPEKHELYILFDLISEEKEHWLDILEGILEKFNDEIIMPLANRYSWKHSKQKDSLIKILEKKSEHVFQEEKRTAKRRINEYKDRFESYKRDMENAYANMMRFQAKYDALESVDTSAEKLIKELDMIAEHPKALDIEVKDDKYIVHTDTIICTSDKGKHYMMGKYQIEMKPEHAEVRFKGGIPRRSYWTHNDPHPHVNGNSGDACLGNVSSTIAELCGQTELYALFLTAVDFLESANTSDSAGRNIVNWDEVDEEGNPVDTDYIHCHRCDRRTNEEDATTVYRTTEDVENGENGHIVCEDCLDEYYYFDDEVEEYIED